MPVRPSKLWKDLPPDTRLAAAEAFWRDDRGPDATDPQKIEAVIALAKRLNFRARSIQAQSVDRRSHQLAHLPDVSDAVAARALIAYHLAAKRPLMRAFLDALAIAHEDGIITAEEVAPPDVARLTTAIEALRQAFPAEDVSLYLATLSAVDGDTWAGIDAALAASH